MPYRRDSGRKVRDYTVKDSDNSVDIARYLARYPVMEKKICAVVTCRSGRVHRIVSGHEPGTDLDGIAVDFFRLLEGSVEEPNPVLRICNVIFYAAALESIVFAEIEFDEDEDAGIPLWQVTGSP